MRCTNVSVSSPRGISTDSAFHAARNRRSSGSFVAAVSFIAGPLDGPASRSCKRHAAFVARPVHASSDARFHAHGGIAMEKLGYVAFAAIVAAATAATAVLIREIPGIARYIKISTM